ncbi:hypothetical protein K438DRAFT_1971012 [Mycena galopus ATCC 62051]|nr:hypothetical protein K438DRAFT_1971012 [Mycena galopus ATCC 62051]
MERQRVLAAPGKPDVEYFKCQPKACCRCDTSNETSSNAYLAAPTFDSFDIIDTTSSTSSEFELSYNSDTESMPELEPLSDDEEDEANDDALLPFPTARAAEQIAAEAFLQAGQPYLGDDHIQAEERFLVYQTSDTEHVIMDNMIDEDVLIPTRFIRDADFDIIAWYTAHRRRTLGLPEEDDDPSDTSSDRSDDSDDDSNGDGGPEGSCGAVSAFVVEAEPARKYVVVIDSGATEHCFWRREDFAEYHPVESRQGNAAEGSKFRILATGVVRKFLTYQGQRKEIAFNAIHTPDITANLISISKLDAKGYEKPLLTQHISAQLISGLISDVPEMPNSPP